MSDQNDTKTGAKSALILIEYQNDWLASSGSINPQFQDREQIETAIATLQRFWPRPVVVRWK